MIKQIFPNMNSTSKFYAFYTSLGGTIGSLTEILSWFQTATLSVDGGDLAQAMLNAAGGTLAALIIGAIWKGGAKVLKWVFQKIKNKWFSKKKDDSLQSKSSEPEDG